MEQGVMAVIIGVILGGVLCFVTAYVVGFLKKRSGKKDEMTKEEIMTSIGELCAEIDSLITSNKEGILNNAGIQNAIKKKNDEIIFLLKPNMHLLDVYFVKYIDQVQKEYQKYISGTVIESNQPTTHAKTGMPNFEKPEIAKPVIPAHIPPRTGSVEQDLHALESAFFKEQTAEPSSDSRKKTLETIFSAPKESIKTETVPEKTQEEFSIDDLTFEEKTDEEDQGHPSVESAIDAIFEPAKQPPAAAESKPVVFDKKEEPQAAPVNAEKADESVSEEEFTMETIMDLDVNKLPGSTPLYDMAAKKPLDVQHQPAAQETPAAAEDDEIMFEAPQAQATPPAETSQKDKPIPLSVRKAAAQPAVKPKPIISKVVPEAMVREKKDIDITGDDVASKIDAFFGIDEDKA